MPPVRRINDNRVVSPLRLPSHGVRFGLWHHSTIEQRNGELDSSCNETRQWQRSAKRAEEFELIFCGGTTTPPTTAQSNLSSNSSSSSRGNCNTNLGSQSLCQELYSNHRTLNKHKLIRSLSLNLINYVCKRRHEQRAAAVAEPLRYIGSSRAVSRRRRVCVLVVVYSSFARATIASASAKE